MLTWLHPRHCTDPGNDERGRAFVWPIAEGKQQASTLWDHDDLTQLHMCAPARKSSGHASDRTNLTLSAAHATRQNGKLMPLYSTACLDLSVENSNSKHPISCSCIAAATDVQQASGVESCLGGELAAHSLCFGQLVPCAWR